MKFLLAVMYGCHLNEIQTALKPLGQIEKKKLIFMIILGLAESFKTMNQPSTTAALFDSLLIGNYQR